MTRSAEDWSCEVSAPDIGAVFGVPRQVLIAELLELCDGFFATAGPAVHAELDEFLISRGLHSGAALGWFRDVLCWTAEAECAAAHAAGHSLPGAPVGGVE